MSGSPDVLLLGAFHPEIAPLRSLLGPTMQGDVGPLRVAARVVGIGLPMAAAGAAMHLAELKPRATVVLGTCGAYRSAGLALGEVVVAGRLRLVDPSVLSGAAQYPEPMSVLSESNAGLAQSLARAKSARIVDVATTLAVTVDDAVAAAIALGAGVHVEHLEAHGVATACAARGVPFAVVLGVANFVGSSARAEWRIHHRSAAAAAAETVVGWLREGGFFEVAPVGA